MDHISKNSMKLVSSEAEEIFGSSHGIRGDFTIGALLRALVINRGERGIEKIKERSCVSLLSACNDHDIEQAMSSDWPLSIVETNSGYFPDTFTYDGWRTLEGAPRPLNKYLSQFAKTKVYVNDELQHVVAVVERRATMTWTQAFLSTFFCVFPWYFPSEPTPEERDFFKSISVREGGGAESARSFIEYVNKAAELLDLRDMLLHKQLDGYGDRTRKARVDYCKNEADSITSRIREIQRNLADQYRRLSENNLLLTSLMKMSASETNEVYDFFKSHKVLSIESVDDNRIRYGVTETLDFYDEDEFMAIYENESSYLYDEASDDTIKAFHAIFVEHKASFITNAMFYLESMRYVGMIQDEMTEEDVLPHPHIYFYGCGGGNDQYYSQYAESGDWELAIEQSIAATKNLNFGDSTVVGKMIRWLEGHNGTHCVKLASDGSIVSFREFIEMVKKEG